MWHRHIETYRWSSCIRHLHPKLVLLMMSQLMIGGQH
jgi:hypothetical protein